MNEIIDDGIISEFLAKGRNHLDAIESDLLTLEKQGEDISPEVVNRVFRTVHSIKSDEGLTDEQVSIKLFSQRINTIAEGKERSL